MSTIRTTTPEQDQHDAAMWRLLMQVTEEAQTVMLNVIPEGEGHPDLRCAVLCHNSRNEVYNVFGPGLDVALCELNAKLFPLVVEEITKETA